MRYVKAPIVEAVLEFRWSEVRSLADLKLALEDKAFNDFGDAKPRVTINTAFDVGKGELSQDRKEIGYETSVKDGTERVFLEERKFVYIKNAPYTEWNDFRERAIGLIHPFSAALNLLEFSRIGLRFINRIDIPVGDGGKIDTDEYISIKFDGPREDAGSIDEFQMRVVKPTVVEGISYALVVATSQSPLSGHTAIILDIDVFTKFPVPYQEPTFSELLSSMREQKNGIFESCITDKSRELFGGMVK